VYPPVPLVSLIIRAILSIAQPHLEKVSPDVRVFTRRRSMLIYAKSNKKGGTPPDIRFGDDANIQDLTSYLRLAIAARD